MPENNGEEKTAQLQPSEHLLGNFSSRYSDRVVEGVGTTPDRNTSGLEDPFRPGQCHVFEQAEQEEVCISWLFPCYTVMSSVVSRVAQYPLGKEWCVYRRMVQNCFYPLTLLVYFQQWITFCWQGQFYKSRLYFHNLPSPSLSSGKSITVTMQKQASNTLMITNGISCNRVFCATNNRTPSTYLDESTRDNWSGDVVWDILIPSKKARFKTNFDFTKQVWFAVICRTAWNSTPRFSYILYSVKNFQAAVWKFNSTVYLIFNYTFSLYREKS